MVLPITEKMKGHTISMRVGDRRKLELEGNATTGYAWRVSGMDGTSICMEGGCRLEYRASEPLLVGSGGKYETMVKAVEPGMTDVYFAYDRSWERQKTHSIYMRFDVRA